MSKFIAMGVLGVAAVLLTIPLTGCSEGPAPTPTTTPTSSVGGDPVPAVTAQVGSTQTPPVAPADTAISPTPSTSPETTAAPEVRSTTIDEYLSLCSQRVSEQADRATYGNLYSAISKEADRFAALTPPAALSEWHALEMDVNRKILELLDLQPRGASLDFANLIFISSEVVTVEQKRNAAADQLPDDIRQQGLETGCIRESTVIVTSGFGPTTEIQPETVDHGDDIKGATAVVVGAETRGVLENEEDLDYFRFKAEAGQSYQLGIQPFDLFHPQLILLNDEGQEVYSTGSVEQVFSWEAPESQDYYVVVKSESHGAGGYVFFISQAVDDHGNDPDGATPAELDGPLGGLVGGNIDSRFDADYFRFTAEEGRNYEIVGQLHSLEVSPNVDLFDSEGGLLASTRYKGSIPYPPIRWQAPASGDYFVRVTTELGQYTVGGGGYLLYITLVR